MGVWWVFGLLLTLLVQDALSLQLYWISPREGSIAGGTTIEVRGSGFLTDQYTGQNFVYLGDIPCIVQGYTVSPSRLHCVTMPYPGAFEGVSSQRFKTKVLSKGLQAQSSSYYATFRFNWNYTPQVRDVLPSSGPVDSFIEVGGYRFSTDIANRYTFIYLGNQICDFWNEESNSVYGGRWSNSLYYIKCLVREQIPGAWSVSAFLTGYSGKTWNHSQSMKLGHDGKLSMFELYPDIHSVQPQVGGSLGGTLLTITGTGFGIARSDMKLEVDIDGVPCEVIKHSQKEIKCWTKKPSNYSEGTAAGKGYRYKGSRGVSVHHFSVSSSINVNHLYSLNNFPDNPDKVAIFPSFSPENYVNFDHYGARYMAFFTPVQSGNHTFIIKSDDSAILYLGKENNVSDLTEIARVYSYTSWSSNTAVYSSSRSEPLYMVKGEKYLLVGDMAEVYGADFLRVGVLMHETTFLHNETTQSVRERQLIEFTSHGHYDIQSVFIKINMSSANDATPPVFELMWGSRSRNITLNELANDEDIIAVSANYLLEGICEFEPEMDVSYFNGQAFDFESENYVKETSYCGLSSVNVVSETFVFEGKNFSSSDYPFLCMAYRIPADVQADALVHIDEIGWRSVSLTTGIREHQSVFLADWSDGEYANDIIADDTWRYGCTNIHSLMTFLDSDQLKFTISGFGFQSLTDDGSGGFYIDTVSFTSLSLSLKSHQPPSKPNGITIDRLINTTQRELTDDDSILLVNVTFEIIPATCDHEIPLMILAVKNDINDSVLDYGVQRLQNASEPIQGTYQLGMDGYWTDPIDYFTDATDIRDALNALPNISGTVNVWYASVTLPQDKLGKYCPGGKLVVRFDRKPGDIPLLSINSSNMTGHGLVVSIKEIETGGLYLYPIPGHMLQSVEKTPQVHVRINNQLAACGGGLTPYEYSTTYTDPCGFTVSESLTPFVSSISPTTGSIGDNITIVGTGFSSIPSDNFILFGEIECNVTQATNTSLVCTLGEGQAGIKELWLHVLTGSVADADGITFEYSIVVYSMEPSASGTGGGVELTLTGDGFAVISEEDGRSDSEGYTYSGHRTVASTNCSSWKNKVLVGSEECEISSFSRTSLKCVVPPGAAGNVLVTASVYCEDIGSTESYSAVLTTQFTYNSTFDPTITSISPSSGSGRGGDIVTITGGGFIAPPTDEITVMIGTSHCNVLSVVDNTTIQCLTSPHTHGSAGVTVTVPSSGSAVGTVEYQYLLEVTGISKCTGSFLGGHLVAISGVGFGEDSSGVEITIDSVPCSVENVTDAEITCLTGSTASTHIITNNAENPDYGLGYAWDRPDISITIGDSVEWKWTGSAFTPMKRVVEVDSASSTQYNGDGFASEQAVTGSYTQTFSSPGTYYYIMEGYGEIGFRGSINVQPHFDFLAALMISFNSVDVFYNSSTQICGQVMLDKTAPTYSHLVDETPVIVSIFPSIATQGSVIQVSVEGIISLKEYNVLTIGGKPCIKSSHTSTTMTEPVLELPTEGTYSYTDAIISCTVPDVYPGDYRAVLHVSGRGWAYGEIHNTQVSVEASIHNSYSTFKGSQAGGSLLTIPVTGLDPYVIGQTNVYIGNTPCLIQQIVSVSSSPLYSEIVCKTMVPRNNGYSSLIAGSALNYWSLQYDFYDSSNVIYSTESTLSFADSGKLSIDIPAEIVGDVVQGENGISGKQYIDQSAYFSSSYLLVKSYDQYQALSSFSIEMWFKNMSPMSTDKYVILGLSYQNEGKSARGFLVAVNPCNEIEYWVGTGEQIDDVLFDSSGEDGCEELPSCYSEINESCIIQDTDNSYDFQLPVGVWRMLRSSPLSQGNEWNHLVFGFDAIENKSGNNNQPLFGYQRMYINNELYETNASYHHANESDISFGGSGILHTQSIPASSTASQLSPFIGYIDEIALYDYMLQEEDVDNHYHYGTTDEQPIWINSEYIDGVGTGMVPNTEVPLFKPSYDELELDIDLADINENSFSITEQKGIRIKWTGVHGIYQVASSSYENCLQVNIVKEWSPPQLNGSLIIWLESGQTYYFIDSAGDNCIEGIKFKISVGGISTVEWTIGEHQDVTINEGDGIVFKWNDAVSHNVIQMSTAESVSEECMFVGDKAASLGKVVKEWHSSPTPVGEVIVSGLSVGKHYFVCSVGSHCKLGMRLTVNVLSLNTIDRTDEDSNEHVVPWYIPTTQYEVLNIIEGEDILFAWNGFHSLHQVDEDVYKSCDTSVSPLYEWGRPSVDNSARISGLRPGTYYFICSVSGHCEAGMKLQVNVNTREPIPLGNLVTANCDTVTGRCSFAYSESLTPTILSVEKSTFKSGDSVTLKLSNYDFAVANSIGDILDTTIVLIGNNLCSNVILAGITQQYNEIVCTAPNLEAGSYKIQVHIKDIGFARPNGSVFVSDYDDDAFVVSVIGTASSVTPGAGSIAGGTAITLTGTGFSHLGSDMSVDIGGHECTVVESSRANVVCITSSALSQNSDIPISVSVKGALITHSLTFDYSLNSTPMVTSLSKTENVVGGDLLTITGEKFSSDASNITVEILKSDEPFYHDAAPDRVICQISTALQTSIQCTTPFRGAGLYLVVVHIQGKGLSKETTQGSSLLVYKLAVEEVYPLYSGHGGGLTLNITGSGFPVDFENDMDIRVCNTLCQVSIVYSEALLSCILGPSGSSDPSSNMICDVIISYNSLSATFAQNFTFSSSLTTHVISISPTSGGTAGGTYVTIEGEGFLPLGTEWPDLEEEDLVIMIDGAACEWYDQTPAPPPNGSTLVCRTSDHRTTVFAEIDVFVKGKGNALVADGVTYQYVDRWSSKYTWGGQEPPLKGESVYIKEGQTVFLDTDTPVLNLILIEGELIFEDQQDVHLQANYIFINNGRLQIGTEEMPFSHRATISLHGNVRDPEIPIYGAKVIGIRQGELDIHGQKRNTTWTRLSSTALKNSTYLELQDAVDWLPGDAIVIAPTGKEGNETETSIIDYVSEDGLTVYLRNNLTSTHHGVTETFENGASIEIRAEVGLLSHNVIIQGALEENSEFDGTGADQYGMQIMIHRTGPHPTPIRIENAEVRYAGQAFRLGRYAIHFHLSGNMSGSYVRNCAIHHSNNRALTAHGVHNLLIEGNVAYDIKGHAFFVEDGIETNNRYLRNLGIYIRSSSSLLNTDQLPAVFWITNPNNIFIDNAAVASRAYGFWYDLDGSPSGPSFTSNVCPNKEVFGQFSGNLAHSCNEFGLRIWETYTPFNDGCGAKDSSTAVLYNFTTYSNDIHGVEFSVIGNVKMVGFKVADNRDNAIEIQETNGDWEEATIEDALLISHTSLNNGDPGTGGIRAPNTRGFKVSNVTFVNFNFPQAACLRACSHCKVFQGGWQVLLEKLNFIGNSSLHKTSFQWEHEVLFHDLDGSLSGEVGGWVMPNSGLHPSQYCSKSVPEFSVNKNVSGSVCSADVYPLRMAWNQAEPLVTFKGIPVNVSNEFGSSIVPWRHYRLTHTDGYMLTLPSTYMYSFKWQLPAEHTIDIMSYSAGLYSLRPDEHITVSHGFVQVPDHVNIGGNHFPSEDALDDSDPNLSWYIDNTTDSVSYIISSLNSSESMSDIHWTYRYEPCPVDGCPLPPDPNDQPLEATQRRWSDPTSWPNGTLPAEGDDVTIRSTWRMLLDISPPPLWLVHIIGELQFEDVRDYNFTANTILISGPNAHFIVGLEASPFSHTAVITLTGKRNDEPLFLSDSVRIGSKAIGIFGNVTLIGQPNSHSWTRLEQSCAAGDSIVHLRDQPDWKIGDRIVISSSSYEPSEAEVRSIISYDSITGAVTIDEPLEYNHTVHQLLSDTELSNWANISDNNTLWWGGEKADVMLSPEVGLLSHNIIIQGGEESDEPLEEYHYGCRIIVGEYDSSQYTYTGTVAIDSIEVRFCGQGGYFSPIDPRYSIVFKDIEGSDSYITRSSIHHGYNTGIGIHGSSGIEISNNVVYRTTGSSIACGGFGNSVLGNLAMLTSTVQPNMPLDNHAVDFPATFDINHGNTVRDNAAAGSHRISYRYSGDECDEDREPVVGEQAQFWNNTAHSGLIALVILGLPKDCASVGGLTASHHWDYSVFSSSASSISVTHMKLAIGKVGFNLNIFGPNPVNHLLGRKSITIKNSLIVGFIPLTACEQSKPANAIPGVSLSKGDPSIGIMMSSFNKRKSKMDGTGKWHLMKGYPTVDGEAKASGVTFAHFAPPPNCGYGSALIGNNPISPDAVHPLELRGVVKLDVPQENLVHFYDPNPNWIVQEDCVDMDCDGPKHALIRDADGTFGGTAPTIGSVVPFAELRFDNYSSRVPLTWLDFEDSVSSPESVVNFRGVYRGNPFMLNSGNSCIWMESWNAYHCNGLDHLMLVIESMDKDTEVRRLSPLALVGNGVEEYTDLLNGPMDHGWCTYYTCLKRLSTFFSLVSTNIDYHIWTTGSLPDSLRLHLLNSNDNQAIRVNIWYKDPQRKDVYKNGIFIEPKNTNFLDNGAVTQLDGDYTPSFDSFSGANYFEKKSQILTILLKGSVPVEIRTPPVVQVSLSVAVTVEQFFLTNLISNLAFVLKIDISTIRVVNVISEDSVLKRRSLLQVMSKNTVTLEFGDPPETNVDPPETATSEGDWMEGDGERDNVDIEDESKSTVLAGNPFNEEPPESDEEFAAEYNMLAESYDNTLKDYNKLVAKVDEVNKLGSDVVELVQSGGLMEEFAITSVALTLAVAPAAPAPPVVPPQYSNITDGNVTLTVINETASDTMDEVPTLEFLIPSILTVSREPSPNTGHLIYVAVSMLDANGNLVKSLGYLNPWKCTAMLVTSDKSDSAPKIEGETEVFFEEGIAVFTRLRVDRASSNLRLTFITSHGSFEATTSVSFTVHEPSDDVIRREIVLILVGNTSIISSLVHHDVVDDIKRSLGNLLDVDYSRIQEVEFAIQDASHVQVTFDLLDNVTTDPPNVPSLSNSIETLQSLMENMTLIVLINGTAFRGLNGSIEVLLPTEEPIRDPLIVIVSIATVASSIILLMFVIPLFMYYWNERKSKIKPAEYDDRDEASEMRMLRIPRASVTNPPPPRQTVPHRPHSPLHLESLEETELESIDGDELWFALDETPPQSSEALWDFPTPNQMPRIPRPFSGVPSSTQQRQSRTLASFAI